jgi:Cu(I)/Ag(I) efflux system membrane fusion protein
VRRGEVLATIYSPVLLSTQQELLTARRWSGTGDAGGTGGGVRDTLLDGARRRLELAGMSPDDIRQVERSGQPMRAVAVRAPVDGYVIAKSAVHGLYVEPGTKLFEIADLSTVWVLADVYEHDVGRVGEGATARLTLPAYPDDSFEGRVEFVYPTMNPETRTLRLRLAFPNRGLRLRPGMYGDVFIALPDSEGLVVPRDAIVDTGEHRYVFLARDGGRFEPRLVTTGARSGDLVEVRSGVESGDVVVTTANFLLDSESRLRAAITGGGGRAPVSADCDQRIDRARFPEKWDACRACEVQHRGMGSMETDCKDGIAKPWR